MMCKYGAAIAAASFAALMMAAPAQADVAEGVWKTEPDKKGQIGHVKISQCGAALCGTIISAYDKNGKEIRTKNVGKRIVTQMSETQSGTYEGRVLVPVIGRTLNGKMQVSGARLKLSGCLAGICDSQTWVRVR